MGSRVCCCYLYLLCMCVYSVTLSVRCFHLLSSMCRTSEIDRRCVHLPGSDRCEISYAATLTRSTFEDTIGVNFIIMLLYSCTRITPRVCTLVLFILLEISRRTRWWCLISMVELSLTLGAHARSEGYSSCRVCVCVHS